MRILFLDIDGVLNSDRWFRQFRSGWGMTIAPYPHGHIDPEPVKLLNEIIAKTGCQIVISSSWRLHNTVEALTKTLQARGFAYPNAIIGRTPNLDTDRGCEIMAWLTTNKAKKFAIVDDDDDMGILANRLVKTSFKTGLTETEAKQIIKLLQ